MIAILQKSIENDEDDDIDGDIDEEIDDELDEEEEEPVSRKRNYTKKQPTKKTAKKPTKKAATKKKSLNKKALPKQQKRRQQKQSKHITRSKDRPNLFVELGLDRLHKADSKIDKKLNVYPPMPRRGNVDLVPVKCRVCGEEEEVPESQLFEGASRYKCNECCRNPG